MLSLTHSQVHTHTCTNMHLYTDKHTLCTCLNFSFLQLLNSYHWTYITLWRNLLLFSLLSNLSLPLNLFSVSVYPCLIHFLHPFSSLCFPFFSSLSSFPLLHCLTSLLFSHHCRCATGRPFVPRTAPSHKREPSSETSRSSMGQSEHSVPSTVPGKGMEWKPLHTFPFPSLYSSFLSLTVFNSIFPYIFSYAYNLVFYFLFFLFLFFFFPIYSAMPLPAPSLRN